MHRVFLTVGAVLLTAACSSNPTIITPTPPTTIVTEPPFVATLAPDQQAHTFTFAVGGAGTVTATLTSIAPDSNDVIGISLGTWNGSACQIVLPDDQATQNQSITAVLNSAGNLCVRAYVTAPLPGVETCTIVVTHP